MTGNINVDETTVFQRILAEEIPLLDVRAPAEFLAGSLPGAVNLPIMDDEQRRQVGTCYKGKGKEAALALGSRLVSGDIREERVAGWIEMISGRPRTMIYCARGGLRSHIARKWIEEQTGKRVELLEGGYKAFRRYLLAHLNPDWLKSRAIVIGGRTGVGKTQLIDGLQNSIDLEAIANHRGSSFGSYISAQPCGADFENRLAAALIRHSCCSFRHIVVEDEGRHIGRRFLPLGLVRFFASGSLIVVEVPLEQRVANTHSEYVVAEQGHYRQRFGTSAGMQKWISAMESGIDRIVKKLGPARHRQVRELFSEACTAQEKRGDAELHKRWIEELLRFYYDPMYDFQLERDRRTVIFKGSPLAVRDYLQSIDL